MTIRIGSFAMVLVLGAAGCAVPLPGTHGTMHPSVQGDSNGAGAAVGAIDAQTDDGSDSGNVFAFPYGEGWARFTAGPGAFELRVGAPFASAAYRWVVVDGADSDFGFSLIPGVGLAYVRSEDTSRDAMGVETTDIDAEIAFAPEMAFLFTFVQGQLYLAPRIGWFHTAQVAGAPPMADTTSDFLSYGAALGWNFAGMSPFWYSLELSLFVVDHLPDDPMSDQGTTWYFIPTFGFHTG